MGHQFSSVENDKNDSIRTDLVHIDFNFFERYIY